MQKCNKFTFYREANVLHIWEWPLRIHIKPFSVETTYVCGICRLYTLNMKSFSSNLEFIQADLKMSSLKQIAMFPCCQTWHSKLELKVVIQLSKMCSGPDLFCRRGENCTSYTISLTAGVRTRVQENFIEMFPRLKAPLEFCRGRYRATLQHTS